MRFAKPLDEKILHDVFTRFKNVITIEDGCLNGGFGSAVLEFMNDNGYHAKVVRLGIPDRFIEHATQKEQQAECGFDTDSICAVIKSLVKKRSYARAK